MKKSKRPVFFWIYFPARKKLIIDHDSEFEKAGQKWRNSLILFFI